MNRDDPRLQGWFRLAALLLSALAAVCFVGMKHLVAIDVDAHRNYIDDKIVSALADTIFLSGSLSGALCLAALENRRIWLLMIALGDAFLIFKMAILFVGINY